MYMLTLKNKTFNYTIYIENTSKIISIYVLHSLIIDYHQICDNPRKDYHKMMIT